MANHYHLLIETPEANLVAGMHWLQSSYTAYFNRQHHVCGHLFQGRYKAVIVDSESRGYFAMLADDIHLNPVRAYLVGPEQRLVDYRWSSYPAYVTGRGRPGWMETSRVLGEAGAEDTSEGRRRFAVRMRERAVATLSGEDGVELERIRGSWCLGGESFRERMRGIVETVGGREPRASAAKPLPHDRTEAERLIRVGLAHFGLRDQDLRVLQKGDPRKLAIARVARSRSAVSSRWLAEALHAGHVTRLSPRVLDQLEVKQLAASLENALEITA